MSGLVIVGGSDAGIAAALRARELDATTELTVLVADAYPNFSICGLPYLLSGEVEDWRSLAHPHAPSWRARASGCSPTPWPSGSSPSGTACSPGLVAVSRRNFATTG